MADVAISRVQLVDNSQRRDGKRIHKVLPWQIVTVEGHVPMLEPLDFVGFAGSGSTTKQITGIQFVDADVFYSQNGCGGDGVGLRYA
jgi:hypothetical protein